MQPEDNIRRVAIVGTGLIGSSWAALFLAHGLDVIAVDPAPGAEAELRNYVKRVWPDLEKLALTAGASPTRLQFSTELAAIAGVDFVQENGPERADFKIKLFADMDQLLPPSVILASSSSGLTMSVIQSACKNPGRCVIGHPFNPPHLIPLVELVGGKATSPETIARAEKFYSALGKQTIRVNKEVAGHVANRLQAALWREAVHLVANDVVSVSDVDAAVSSSLGLRWSLMGPNLIFHLGGGQGGMPHFMSHLAGPFSTWWADLGSPVLTTELKEKIIQGVQAEAAGRSINELAKLRDEGLLKLIALRREIDARTSASPT